MQLEENSQSAEPTDGRAHLKPLRLPSPEHELCQLDRSAVCFPDSSAPGCVRLYDGSVDYTPLRLSTRKAPCKPLSELGLGSLTPLDMLYCMRLSLASISVQTHALVCLVKRVSKPHTLERTLDTWTPVC